MEENFALATQWFLLALVAAVLSVKLGISVALMEIAVGVVGGNAFQIEITPWVTFLAGIAAVLLTFMAGTEIDPVQLRKNLKESLLVGIMSFLLPFIGGFFFASEILGWDLNAAKIAGIALSTTSVAVVYAVMLESGLSKTKLGQSILASCFVTDIGTVLALGLLFTGFSIKIVYFTVIMVFAVMAIGRFAKYFFACFSGRVSEPDIKFVFVILFFLAWVALECGSEAVLPAYIMGLAMAGFFKKYKETLAKMRAIVFSVFNPFYFMKAGALVSLGALSSMWTAVAMLLLLKMVTKFIGVFPMTRLFQHGGRVGIYTTLLMSTGLTFGTIASLYGLSNNYIDSSQYSALVATVILSAIIPTIIAQKFFFPNVPVKEES